MTIKTYQKLKALCYPVTLGTLVLLLLLAPVRELVSIAQSDPLSVSDQVGIAESTIPSEEELENIRQAKNLQFLNKLKTEISINENNLEQIDSSIETNQQKIEKLEEKITSLEGQLENLENLISNSETIIANVIIQISTKESEIEVLETDLDTLKTEISFQKMNISDYLRTLYIEENKIREQNSDQTISTLKLLLSDEKAGDVLSNLRYSHILEETGRRMIEKLDQFTIEQKIKQSQLYLKRQSLIKMQSQLEQEKEALEIRKKAKGALLRDSKGQEKIYQELLASSKVQQEQVSDDISTLKANLDFIRSRMNKLGKGFDPSDYSSLLKTSSDRAIYEFIETSRGGNFEFQPRWPISPAKGLSAYFHDSGYVRVFGVPHNAIDIPVYQGTEIKSPALGVVYKTKDNGMGYSYIILAHANGYMTVYGHVSEINVQEGDLIREGEVIGRSGGTPGTKGAGYMTTGAHLHYEIIKDGKYMDPLNYLNLAYLKLDNLPERYQDKALGDQDKVRRESGKVPVKESNRPLSIEEMVEQQGTVR